MQRFTLLDPTRTGRQAEELENKLHRLVVGQDEAIHRIVRAYQTHAAGLSPAGRPIGNFSSWGQRVRERLALSRRRPSPCCKTLVQ
jgi:hypothetical protein